MVDISAHAVSGVVSLRFRGESGGDSYDYMNDLLVDDVCVVEAPILGCTDPLACNYDPSATIDDASCIVFSAGCTDSLANSTMIQMLDVITVHVNIHVQLHLTVRILIQDSVLQSTSNLGTGSYPGWYGGTSHLQLEQGLKTAMSLVQARSCMLRLQELEDHIH